MNGGMPDSSSATRCPASGPSAGRLASGADDDVGYAGGPVGEADVAAVNPVHGRLHRDPSGFQRPHEAVVNGHRRGRRRPARLTGCIGMPASRSGVMFMPERADSHSLAASLRAR